MHNAQAGRRSSLYASTLLIHFPITRTVTEPPDPPWLGAANRSPDKVDADPASAEALNTTATHALARLTSSRHTLLLYISTDYVFPGTPGDAPYGSDAPTSPPNTYGRTKRDGELSVLAAGEADGLGVVLRVPVLYGVTQGGNDESAVNVLLDAVLKAQTERVVMDDWAIRYPTNTEDVGRVCRDVARLFLGRSREERLGMQRVLQFSAEMRTTKYGICEMLAEVMGLGMGMMEANKQGNDPAAKVQRPFDCHLSTRALVELGVNVEAQDFRDWW